MITQDGPSTNVGGGSAKKASKWLGVALILVEGKMMEKKIVKESFRVPVTTARRRKKKKLKEREWTTLGVGERGKGSAGRE